MKKIAALSLSLALAAAALVARASDEASFSRVVAFATKTGFRGVVSWQADRPVRAHVRWGTTADTLDKTTLPLANLVDTAQVALLETLPRQSTVYYQVVDELTGAATPVQSFRTVNAYTDFDEAQKVYTVDVLVQVDAPTEDSLESPDTTLPDVAAAINVLAERVYDATDGWVRIGRALVTDTVLNHPVNVPGGGTPCSSDMGYRIGGTAADILVETTLPYDSHTWSGWMIDNACTAFYIGRLGQLGLTWQDDLHMGYVMAHEFMHYAFNSPDRYSLTGSGCVNSTWDGSIMHNSGGYHGGRWTLTELDRAPDVTPCGDGKGPWSWHVLRRRYREVPPPSVPDSTLQRARRGNPDGDALEIFLLKQLPGGSTLAPYTPVDTP